jgi:transcriptional regulator with XRE-family HTH domain
MPRVSISGLAERLRSSASKAGLTSTDLAEKLGVSASTIRAWWAGRNLPSPLLLERYADEVDQFPADLLLGSSRWYPLAQEQQEVVEWYLESLGSLVRSADKVTSSEAHGCRRRFVVFLDAEEQIQKHVQESARNAGQQLGALETDWQVLTDDERGVVVQLVKELAKNRRQRREGV